MSKMLIILPNPLKYGVDDIKNNPAFTNRLLDTLTY